MDYKNIIAAAYDKGVEEEYNRLVSTPLFEAEFRLISELIEKYVEDGSTVIDIGAGPGRYAEFLLKKNCDIGLVDLSAKSLEAFHNRISNKQKEHILFSKVSCATSLPFIESNFADAVLLMGPLYHLTHCEERTQAIAEAFRILKPQGLLFAVFMSTFNKPHFHENEEHHAICCTDYVKQLLKDSITTIKFQGYNVPQYRCLPSVAKDIIEQKGFGTMHLRNIEGIGVNMNHAHLEKINDQQSKEQFFDSLRQTCESEDLLGYTHQFLYVGRKK